MVVIVRMIIRVIVAYMDLGNNRIITVPAVVSVIPTGVAAIVRKINRMPVMGMDLGNNRLITVPVVVTVIPTGAVVIVL